MSTAGRKTQSSVSGGLIGLLATAIALPAQAFEMEMNALVVADTFTVPSWTSVVFLQAFDNPPLVFALPTNQGSDPATLRIRNITSTGFEVLQTEPSGNDGPHVEMGTAYLAIEAGNHVLPDGTRLVAADIATSAFANRLLSVTWASYVFPGPFNNVPAVLTQIQTVRNESANPPATPSVPFMDVSLQNLGTGSLQFTLERAESTTGAIATPEQVAILAIENQANLSFVDLFGNSIQLQSIATPDNIVGWDDACVSNNYPVAFASNPIAVASVNSRDGNNGGWVRRCASSNSSIGLLVDEDTDNDSERAHTTETAGVVAASGGFHVVFAVDLAVAKSFSTLSDPVNGTSGQMPIPEALVEYRVVVENRGSLSPDSDSMTITDIIPDELALCVTASCQSGGPIVLDASGSPVPPGVSIGAIEYSEDGGASYSYSPLPDANGFDPAVNAVRVRLDGAMASIATTGAPSFELIMAARIE